MPRMDKKPLSSKPRKHDCTKLQFRLGGRLAKHQFVSPWCISDAVIGLAQGWSTRLTMHTMNLSKEATVLVFLPQPRNAEHEQNTSVCCRKKRCKKPNQRNAAGPGTWNLFVFSRRYEKQRATSELLVLFFERA